MAGGAAALPQVHGVLLQHLDLVPSRGGLEAAGLRFLQLQVRGRDVEAGGMQVQREGLPAGYHQWLQGRKCNMEDLLCFIMLVALCFT